MAPAEQLAIVHVSFIRGGVFGGFRTQLCPGDMLYILEASQKSQIPMVRGMRSEMLHHILDGLDPQLRRPFIPPRVHVAQLYHAVVEGGRIFRVTSLLAEEPALLGVDHVREQTRDGPVV